MILCPCTDCHNRFHLERAKVYDHLICVGFKRGYLNWTDHGESNEVSSSSMMENDEDEDNDHEMYEILHDLFSNGVNGRNNKSFSMLLEFLQEELLPDGNILPKKQHEVKNIMNKLGLGWRPNQEDNSGDGSGDEAGMKDEAGMQDEAGIQYEASIQDKAGLQDETERVKDGKLRHPADALSWKHFDEKHPEFASDHRNVRLGLTSDGFNPYRSMNSNYSIWPVFVIPYNLPPWYIMKQPNFILSFIILGPKSPSNKAFDVYMQPLIKELKELWGGIDTFDALTNQNFKMKAAVIFIISDFPGYANLYGWTTKGEYACPVCAFDKTSKWLNNGRKWCYMGHRIWLEPNHSSRKDTRSFDGHQELRQPPILAFGDDILD
ncbi:hypothetical protein Tco_0783623 [Tanacetum coccineum]